MSTVHRFLLAVLTLVLALGVVNPAPVVYAQGVSLRLPWQSGAKLVTCGPACHQGTGRHAVDFGLAYGTTVVAAASGTVKDVYNEGQGCGLGIKISHADGTTSVYCHLSRQLVTKGAWVNQGDPIAASGNSGGVAAHLHFALLSSAGPETAAFFQETGARELSSGEWVTPGSGSGTLNLTLIRSRLYIDGTRNLTLFFCGTGSGKVEVHTWRAGRDFGTRPVTVAFGPTENCTTVYDLDGAGPVNPKTIYYSTVRTTPVRNVCSNPAGLCDSVYSGN